MRPTCLLFTLANDPHTQGLYLVSRLARSAGIETEILAPGATDAQILEALRRLEPGYLGISYRLSPEVGVREMIRMLRVLDEANVLGNDRGFRRVALAGLPETMSGIEARRDELPCPIWTMRQDDDPLRRAERVLEFLAVTGSQRQQILAAFARETRPRGIAALDELAHEVVDDGTYAEEPPLGVPSPAARVSYIRRIEESPMPLLRTHFGVPGDSIEPTVEGIGRLAAARVVDEISLGSSDLSQRYFGQPDEWKDRKNDGGVPYRTFEDLRRLAAASRRGNFPAVKPYAHVTGLVAFVETCLRAGMLVGAHQAVPLFWFNELDGRGATPVPESIREHLAAVRVLAGYGIPVEMNDPNQWSSRWAHDTVICADYGLIAAVMLAAGVRDLVLQLQFNKPAVTGDIGDLAKMGASLQLARELLPTDADAPVIWRETRTGIESLPPTVALAKLHLARSTLLQLMVSPHIIHLVSYCEADHAATVDDIIDSSRLVRRAVAVFRRHRRDLLGHLQSPEVIERRNYLVHQARHLLRAIAGLRTGSTSVPLAQLVPVLADPEVLADALRRGYMAAPGITHSGYPAARAVVTAPRHGGIDCLDPRTGAVVTEQVRLAALSEHERPGKVAAASTLTIPDARATLVSPGNPP